MAGLSNDPENAAGAGHDSRPTRRRFLANAAGSAVGAAAVVAAGWPAAAFAQQPPAPAFQPTRQIRLISPLLAGGATDAVVRPIAIKLSQLWGQSVVVENKPGGGTIIGTQAVVQAPADGYTIGVVISALTINPSLRNDLPYDTFTDITPVTQIGNITGVLVAHPSFPANDLRGLVAQAKSQPGAISYASLGVGTGGHITGELLKVREGIDWVHVPYSGSAAAYRELLPGRIPVGFVVLESALPYVKAGKLKVIGLTDARRNRLYPEFPTLEETVPGIGYESIFGLIGPRGMPPAVLQAMNADIVRVLALPEIREQLKTQAMEVVASSPAEFAAVIQRDVQHWKVAVKESGANVN
jgi:tripartite-type tricarboxylate transporter receptor subunit TctC